MQTTLNRLDINETASLIKVIDSDLSSELLTMGFIEGEEIYVKKKAPLGGPFIICSGSICISIRKSDTELIIVQKD